MIATQAVLQIENHKFNLCTYLISDKRLEENTMILNCCDHILSESWGRFERGFLKNHILRPGNVIVIASISDKPIGFSAVSFKNMGNRNVHYVEFTAITKDFQSKKLGVIITQLAIKKSITLHALRGLTSGVDIMLITPNIRVVATLAKQADYIYPNPFLYNGNYLDFPMPNNETFSMASELIKNSDNPGRVINQRGLVVEGSYKDTPWLLYSKSNPAPLHYDEQVNKFAVDFLDYGKGADKEFIVHARISPINVIKKLLARTT